MWSIDYTVLENAILTLFHDNLMIFHRKFMSVFEFQHERKK